MTQNDEPTDDTTGHVLHGEAAQDPTGIGGRAPSLRPWSNTDDDDSEGHAVRRSEDAPGYRIPNGGGGGGGVVGEEDVEGHRTRPIAGVVQNAGEGHRAKAVIADDDDVEGHRLSASVDTDRTEDTDGGPGWRA